MNPIETENIYRELLDGLTDLIVSVSSDGQILFANQAWLNTLDYSEEEISKLNIFEIIRAESLTRFKSALECAKSGVWLDNIEINFIAKNNKTIKVKGEFNYKNGTSSAINIIFRLAKSNDFSWLQNTEDLFLTFINASPFVTYMKDAKGRYVYSNQKLKDMFSMTMTDLENKTDFEWLPPEIAEKVWENDQSVINLQKTLEVVENVPTPDGVSRFWMVIKFPFTNHNGEKFVGGVAVDITAQKSIEEKLRLSENEIKTLVENSSEIIVRFDRDFRHLYVNPALERQLGKKAEDFIGKSLAEIGMPPSSVVAFEKNLQMVLKQKREVLCEVEFPAPDGIRYFQMRMTPEFKVNDETVESILIVSRDTTQRREAEERLRQSEQHYRNLIDESLGFICTHDRQGTVLSVNQATADALGYKISEIQGKNLADFMPVSSRQTFRIKLETVWQKTTDNGLFVLLAKDGRKLIWKYHNVKLTETVSEPFILGYAQDVTEMHQLQLQLKTLSLTDELTKINNRRGFMTLAERQLRLARTNGKNNRVFLIFADIDGLKQINDRYGHEQGSLAIIKTSEILMSSFRGSDVVARLGGDEFVVLVIDENQETQEIVKTRIEEKIENFNSQSTHFFRLSLSFGIIQVDLQKSVSLEELIRAADFEMYSQKRSKKERYLA